MNRKMNNRFSCLKSSGEEKSQVGEIVFKNQRLIIVGNEVKVLHRKKKYIYGTKTKP